MTLDIIKFLSSANREEISKDVFGGSLGGGFKGVLFLLLLGIMLGIHLKKYTFNSNGYEEENVF